MCIAITKPADTQPDWEAYRHGFNRNPDGWGFAVPDNGRVLIRKDLSKFEDFRAEFECFTDRPALIHFRIKTSGEINKRNCHPFRLTDNLAMIHNGMLDIECSLRSDKSDTWHFVKQVLRPMAAADPRFAWNIGCTFLGEQFVGYNKVAFLDAAGEFAVWNKSAGVTEKDGHWYSNTSYIKPKPFQYSGLKTYSTKGKPKSKHLGWVNEPMQSAIDKWEDESYYFEDDDPIVNALGKGLPADDYEAAQNCLSLGLSTRLIAELYAEDPGLLETIAYYHDSDYTR